MILFFLSHAGGSAKSYCAFRQFLPKELTVVPMELSGRLTRLSEPLLDTVPSCASDLIEKHSGLLGGDYAIFGHSMGTALAAELVRQAKEKGLAAPRHIFLSGKNPPDVKMHCFENADTASDGEIITFFGGGSLSAPLPAVNEELIKLLNGLLCTDVRMTERYGITPAELNFGCDISVLFGTEDPLLKGVDMSGWGRFTRGKCRLYPFTGGHFYYRQHMEEVCGIIKAKLELSDR